MLKAIVAVDENWGIGYNGDLLVSIPNDLKHFKTVTTGSTVIMGLNTWNSLPRNLSQTALILLSVQASSNSTRRMVLLEWTSKLFWRDLR